MDVGPTRRLNGAHDPIRPVATGSYQETQLSYFFAELTPRTGCHTKVKFFDNTREWKPSLAGCSIGQSRSGYSDLTYRGTRAAYFSSPQLVPSTTPPSQLRPTAIDRKFGAGREGRIEPKEEDRLRDFLRRPPALHRDHTGHLLPNLGGLVFTGKHFADDRRVDGTGRHRVDANFARKQLGGERPSE